MDFVWKGGFEEEQHMGEKLMVDDLVYSGGDGVLAEEPPDLPDCVESVLVDGGGEGEFERGC